MDLARGWLPAVAAVALILLRLRIGMRLHVTPLIAPHDDLLFLSKAQLITQGRWLGDTFTQFTLVKGPFYPLFLATTQFVGIRLIVAEQLLYMASCGLFASALAPRLSGRWTRLLIFAVLAFNPMSFATDPATRVIREGIYPALTLAVIAFAVGWTVRLGAATVVRAAWSVGLGASLAVFWLTREEGLWLIPSLCLVGATTLVQRRRVGAVWVRRVVQGCLIAGVIVAISLVAVISANCRRYGVCATTEFGTSWFSHAVRSLYRVKPHNPAPYALLPREARERVYAVSPRFRELRLELEGNLGRHWIRYGPCAALGICDDLAGTWITWAVRDAVAVHGYYARGAEAVSAYYQELANEIDAACSHGGLDCSAPGYSILPPWRDQYNGPLLAAIPRAALFLASFDGFTPGSDPCSSTRICTPLMIALYSRIGESAYAVEDDTDRWIMAALGMLYARVTPVLGGAALGMYAVAIHRTRRKRGDLFLVLVGGVLLCAIVVRLLLLAVIDVTSAPAINVLYTSPLHPLMLAFVVLMFMQRAWRPPPEPGVDGAVIDQRNRSTMRS
jgi:hypothetical protein